ncbi:hypothetical protein V8E51_013762 [Hyaloscypha variabilis]
MTRARITYERWNIDKRPSLYHVGTSCSWELTPTTVVSVAHQGISSLNASKSHKIKRGMRARNAGHVLPLTHSHTLSLSRFSGREMPRMSPDADENRPHSPHSPHSSLSFPLPTTVVSSICRVSASSRLPQHTSALSSLPSPLFPLPRPFTSSACSLHSHLPISPSRHRIYDLSHRGRCASLHYGPTHPYRVIKSRPEFTSRCSPSNTPPARVTPRSTRELRVQGPADTPHGDTTRGLVSEDFQRTIFLANDLRFMPSVLQICYANQIAGLHLGTR